MLLKLVFINFIQLPENVKKKKVAFIFPREAKFEKKKKKKQDKLKFSGGYFAALNSP